MGSVQDAKLTARERQRLEYKRQVYQLAKKRKVVLAVPGADA